MRLLHSAVMAVVLLTGVSGTYSSGQLTQPLSPQEPVPGRREVPPIGPSLSPEMQAQQARTRNSDRQKRLTEDTNKLLVLATQLKQEVDQTNKDVLSVDVVKKADEIEKLAHSVKERMKGEGG